MKLLHTIKIDLLDFFKTGKFDYLKIGKSKEWILNNFPNPDGFEDYREQLLNGDIWHYGNVELHFDKDILFLIFSDYLHDLSGGDSIEISKWILNEPDRMNLDYVMSQLNAERIDFEKKSETYGDQYYVR